MKQTKSILMILGGIILCTAGFFIIKTVPISVGILKTLPYLCIGIGCGIFGHGVGDLGNKLTVRKHPELSKQIEIDQKDERNIMLANMAKAKGYDMMTYVLAALLLAYALMGASFTIIIPLVIAYLFIELYTVYLRIKNDKEF